MERILDSCARRRQSNHEEERSNFVTWVNRVLDKHLGPAIDEFKVAFDLDNTSQSHVDKWVAFALEKQVKILDLHITPLLGSRPEQELHLKNHMPSCFATLTSLSLRRVNVSDQFIDCLVRTCLSLENLCIERSSSLIDINIVSFSLQCLEVSECYKLKSVNISALRLWSFTHYGCPVELNVKHAYSLSKVCIGERDYKSSISYVFESLVNYFSQLEHLALMMDLYYVEANSGIISLPKPLTNLKHLQLCVFGYVFNSLLGWTSFIGELPSLERLTFKLSCREGTPLWPIKKQEGPPLKRLKTLEVCGFIRQGIDLEIATYVIENAIALEQVIVDYRKQFKHSWFPTKPCYDDESAPTRLVDLQIKLPPGVKLIVKPME